MHGVLPGLRVPLAVLAAALCAATAPAAGEEGSRHRTDRPDQDAYVLAMGQHTMSTNLDFDAFARMREKRTGDFLWFRRAGKTYVVEDPATLRLAQELFAPLRALEPEQEALSRRQEELSEKEQELDREQDEIESRMDRLTDDGETEYDGDTEFMVSEETTPPTEEERAELERELDELRGQQEALRPLQREIQAKNRELDAVERSLDAREEKLEREAEGRLWKLIDASIESGVAKPTPRP
jgi:bla regulator protein blaR1